ncbi:ARM repeat-containing protein [Pilatotrama ljubarskyi]|nr:ARM repeat-containing protein [Pilatotrama ljubarskyi]
MPARAPAPFDLDSLNDALPQIFDQAQSTAASHQKNFVALYKLHSHAAAITQPVDNGKSLKLTGERAFEDLFHDMIIRVLPLKKGTTVADRIVKFTAGYTKFITDKNLEERTKNKLPEDDETTSERFLSHFVKFLLKGCTAKDKVVRFRVIQCIADTISHLGEIDEDLYTDLRATLLARLNDKEPTVRTQAVIALSKLSYSEDPSELAQGEPSILDTILDAMAYDTSPDVRRAALLNIPPNPQTLPALLARTRDVDASIRKLVYTSVLEKYCLPKDRTPAAASTVGFTHPRALSIAQRELIVRNGLGDREEPVKAAACKLLGAWVDVVRSDAAKKEDGVKSEGVIEDMIAFLKLFDLTEDTIAEDALSAVLENRVDIYQHIEFEEDYWTSITPERAFLARVFIDKCIAKDDTHKIDTTLPVVTALAFRIQDAYNALVAHVEEDAARALTMLSHDEDERARREEARLDQEFAIGEMLRLALNLDYGDEIGRRKMFQLVRGMLSQDVLPEALLARCLDVLRVLSPSERDLIRVVVEVVHELRDPADPAEGEAEPVKEDVDDDATEMGSPRRPLRPAQLPKPVAEMSPEEKARMDAVDLRCLSLCIGMLERVNGTFEENSTLEGILGELIIPAVKRREMALREKGLISLGLCCLIARRMALSSFQLFLSQVQTAPEVLKIRVLQIIFDILMVHEGAFLGPGSPNGEKIIEFLLQLLEAEELERVQALLVMGIAKLMLSGMVTDERVLQTLVLVFISPETASNQELRQCLSYFFPVYAYSSAANQNRMRKIFIPLYERLTKAYHEWDGEEDMVTPAQVALMFVDWTDPTRAAAAAKGLRKDAEKDPIHLDLATDIVKALFSVDYDKEDKKALCQMLGKLYLPDEVDDDKVRILKLLLSNLRSRRPPRDTAAKNALLKFDAALSKKYERQLENFSEDEFRKLEELRELFEFLDDIIPDENYDDDEPPKKGRKRRSLSVATETTTSAATSGDRSPPPSPRHGKGKAKRRRLSQSDDESDEDDARTETSRASPAPAPTRAVPKRSAAEKSKKAVSKAFQPIVISSDDDDEDDEDEEEATPVAKSTTNGSRRAPASRSSRAKQEARVDADVDDLLDGDVTRDSIMDSSEDEEADEVDNIL